MGSVFGSEMTCKVGSETGSVMTRQVGSGSWEDPDPTKLFLDTQQCIIVIFFSIFVLFLAIIVKFFFYGKKYGSFPFTNQCNIFILLLLGEAAC